MGSTLVWRTETAPRAVQGPRYCEHHKDAGQTCYPCDVDTDNLPEMVTMTDEQQFIRTEQPLSEDDVQALRDHVKQHGMPEAKPMEFARPFRLHLTDGRTWSGAEFTPGGFVCVYTPDQPSGICTIATSLDELLADRTPEDPLHGARVERPDNG